MKLDLDSRIPGTENFIWREFCYLRDWAFAAWPEGNVSRNIMATAQKLERIRALMGRPIHITSGWRPGPYNRKIGGAKYSAHVDGLAADFQCGGITSDVIRKMLRPKLEMLNIRMEDLPGSSWVHIDLREPSELGGRFFRP